MNSAAALPEMMTEHEKFMFDLNGFIVVRNVFSADEVAAANRAVDAQAAGLQPRDEAALRNAETGSPLAATGPRLDMGGMLLWPEPHCNIFRRVLAHPKLLPYYTALCGPGYRLDHQPLLIAQHKDSEGFALHGGPVSAGGRFNPELQYRCAGGELWTSLLAVSVQLCDHAPGDGGFCVVRGSHKLNLPVPADMANGASEDFREHVHQPVTRAGDVVIWSEATVHGATPWRASHERRIALYRFAPANMGYGRGYLEVPDEALATMMPQERAVLEPPYSARLERPLVTQESARDPSGPPAKKARSNAKKELDKKLFGTTYF